MFCKQCNDSGLYRVGGFPLCEPFDTYCSCEKGKELFDLYSKYKYDFTLFLHKLVEARNLWKTKC